MKKIIALITLLMPMLMLGQDLEGYWKFHPTYMLSAATNLIDTEEQVYALTNGSLIQVDKQSGQVKAMTMLNGLSDVSIQSIHYNYDKHYLLVVYTNSNLDFVFDDGRIVNASDLKDVVMNITKTVNDVTFTGGKAYLATTFGMVVFDDNTLHVSEFRNYDNALNSVLKVGDHYVASINGAICAAGNNHELYSDFAATGITLAAAKFYPIDDNNFFAYGTNTLSRCTFDSAGNLTATKLVSATPTNGVQRAPGGWLANFRANSYYYTIDTDFKCTKVSCAATEMFTSCPDGDGTLWEIDGNGIHQKGVTTYYKPEGIYMRTTATPPLFYSYYNPQDGKFYVTTHDQRFAYNNNANANSLVYVLNYDGEAWTDATPTTLRNTTRPGCLAFVPGQPNAYYLAIRSGNNIVRVVDGVSNLAFVQGTNHPLSNLTQPRLSFDSHGNLWMCSTRSASTTPKDVACMLPASKVMQASVSKDDWYVVSVPGLSSGEFQNQIFCIGKNDVKVTHGGVWGTMNLTLWRGTPDSLVAEVESAKLTNPVDQDGKAVDFTLGFTTTMVSDSTGMIWIGGHSVPMFYFDPTEAMDNNILRVTTPKSDGAEATPYEQKVNHIAVDPLNRKWVATDEKGVFVVSADGSQVLKHFDIDNSNLPSSRAYSVAVSHSSAIVLTDKGVVEYDMNEIPTAIDYTAVTATPLLVEPGYTGYVTIGTVEPGAVVRITDRDGNVVREFIATGNEVGWDTCDDTGERVSTGVYGIYAGHSADQLPATPQVRVKVIK